MLDRVAPHAAVTAVNMPLPPAPASARFAAAVQATLTREEHKAAEWYAVNSNVFDFLLVVLP